MNGFRIRTEGGGKKEGKGTWGRVRRVTHLHGLTNLHLLYSAAAAADGPFSPSCRSASPFPKIPRGRGSLVREGEFLSGSSAGMYIVVWCRDETSRCGFGRTANRLAQPPRSSPACIELTRPFTVVLCTVVSFLAWHMRIPAPPLHILECFFPFISLDLHRRGGEGCSGGILLVYAFHAFRGRMNGFLGRTVGYHPFFCLESFGGTTWNGVPRYTGVW